MFKKIHQNIVRNYPVVFLTIFLLSMFTGCRFGARIDPGTSYKVIYPSGYTESRIEGELHPPIEGTEYSMKLGPVNLEDDYDTRKETFLIVNGNNDVLYQSPDVQIDCMRGELQQDDVVWVCAEHWSTLGCSGYVEGHLIESTLFLIDLSDGELLFCGTAGENEFYVTSNGTKCYFYEPGKEESGKTPGTTDLPSQNAQFYYRDTSDWEEKHIVYTFDYVMKPDIEAEKSNEERITFYITEDSVKLVFASYYGWDTEEEEYFKRKIYNIPLGEDIA